MRRQAIPGARGRVRGGCLALLLAALPLAGMAQQAPDQGTDQGTNADPRPDTSSGAPLAAPVGPRGILPKATLAPAGDYRIDRAHARVMFRVNHLGFSNYTAFFRDFSAVLAFDPLHPEAMTLTAEVDPASVETLYPDPGFDFNALIAGPEFLDAAQFPVIRFQSRSVRLTAPDQAAVSGELTLHGVTRPITLRVTFNGGYPPQSFDPGGARIGFSASGTLYRSDFGLNFGLPAPGSTMGVGDRVEIVIEAELTNPDAGAVQIGP